MGSEMCIRDSHQRHRNTEYYLAGMYISLNYLLKSLGELIANSSAAPTARHLGLGDGLGNKPDALDFGRSGKGPPDLPDIRQVG